MLVNGVNISDTWLDETVTKLDCSIAEAVDMYLSDLGKTENEEQKALDNKAKKVKIQHGASTETERKKVERKREPNELKRIIIQALLDGLGATAEIDSATITNVEKYIDIVAGDRTFTVSLTEHRKKKK